MPLIASAMVVEDGGANAETFGQGKGRCRAAKQALPKLKSKRGSESK